MPENEGELLAKCTAMARGLPSDKRDEFIKNCVANNGKVLAEAIA
ncbi:MAG: hypothetical protein RXO24_06855 [Acidilobus sp.]